MQSVILDGENVDFQGAYPDSVAQVWTLLDGHLSQGGRVLDTLTVDGTLWDPVAAAEPSQWGCIEVRSVSQAERIAAMGQELLAERAPIIGAWERQGAELLTQPFEKRQGGLIEQTQALQPMIEHIDLFCQFAEVTGQGWHSDILGAREQLHGGLSHWMDAIEGRDVVVLSDYSAIEMPRLLTSVFAILESAFAPGGKDLDG